MNTDRLIRLGTYAALASFLLTLFCLQAVGQVQGPTEVSPGEFVTLTADLGDNERQGGWLVLDPLDLGYAVDTNQLKCYLAAPIAAGGRVILVSSTVTVDDEGRFVGQQLHRHIIQVSGEPDPEPDPPDPDPDPDKVSKVFAVVVEETSARTAATSKVLVPFVGALQGRGQRVRMIDVNQQAEWITEFLGQSAVERAISDYGLPVMFLWDDTAGGSKKMLFAKPLPATIDEVLADVKEVLK